MVPSDPGTLELWDPRTPGLRSSVMKDSGSWKGQNKSRPPDVRQWRSGSFCLGNFSPICFQIFSVCGDVGDIAAGKKYPNQVFFDIAAGDFFFVAFNLCTKGTPTTENFPKDFFEVDASQVYFFEFCVLFFY